MDASDDMQHGWVDPIIGQMGPFEVARATEAIPGAIKPCGEPQGYVATDQLNSWASIKSAHTGNTLSPKHHLVGQAGLYRPITAPFEIRVLHLMPGTGIERLRGALHHCSLEFTASTDYITKHATCLKNPDKPEPIWYTALSYTWGDPTFKSDATIEFEGQNKGITRSLETALQHLRSPERSVIMWIDQICINQDDPDEKALQIPLMSRIYEYALNTAIWLGPSTLDSAINPFDALETCAANLLLVSEVKPERFESIGLPESDSGTWKDVWELLSRPWFKRLWIIQEVILSEDAWVVCGSHSSSWKKLSDACCRLQESGVSYWLTSKFLGYKDGARTSQDLDICGTMVFLSSAKESNKSIKLQDENVFELSRMLDGTRYAHCFDSRDRVYGLLGLGLGKGLDLEVRYDKAYTAAQLYFDLAVRMLNLSTSVAKYSHLRAEAMLAAMLANVDHDQTKNDAPSWVPDWNSPRRTTSIEQTSAEHSNIYSASGRRRKDQEQGDDSKLGGWDPNATVFVLKNGSKELCVQGKAFDAVASTTALLEKPDLATDDPKTYNGALAGCYNLAKTTNGYPTGSTSVFEAFWRTLVTDKDAPDGLLSGSSSTMVWNRAPEAFAEVFSLMLDETTGTAPSLSGQTYSKRQQLPSGRGKLELSSLRGTRTPAKTYQSVRIAFQRATTNRKFGLTSEGYFGLFPGHACQGDFVCVFLGCQVPFVLRPVEDRKFRLVGECYVHGIMRGEAMESETIPQREFVII